MRVLAIDYGKRRVGIAISDISLKIALPLESICYKSKKELYNKIKKIVDEYDVKKIIIGLPKNLDGSYSLITEEVLKFKNELQVLIKNANFELFDERFTSKYAELSMNLIKVSKCNKKIIKDKIEATLILQSYLDKENAKVEK